MSEQPEPALRAADYDRWFETRWGSYAFAVERDALLDAVGPLDGRDLLDAGCGTGRFTAAFEAAGATVTGVDADPAMLSLARRRTGAQLLHADAGALPLPDDSFDLAVAVTLLEFAERAEQVIDELVRVTRPGGRIVVATLNPRSPWGLAHHRKLRQPPWSQACLRTPGELRELLTERGRLQVTAALYAPGGFPGVARLGPLLEAVGQLVSGAGAFQIATLDLPEQTAKR
ncbi:MAG: class I SAM-dependent methyltransferase [Nitriliruptoraceae bacterium]